MNFLKRMLRGNGKGLFLLALCLAAALLTAGCGGAAGDAPSGKKKVAVTTSFLADMTKELAGDYVDIDLVIPAGEDPHLYVAQPADLKKLKDADLVLYHGLHFEGKMVEILEKRGTAVTADFPADAVLRMEEDGESVVDPHFWFSIALYKKATEKAADSLSKLVPEHEKEIRANCAAYLAKLDALDAEVKEKIASIPEGKRNLVTPLLLPPLPRECHRAAGGQHGLRGCECRHREDGKLHCRAQGQGGIRREHDESRAHEEAAGNRAIEGLRCRDRRRRGE